MSNKSRYYKLGELETMIEEKWHGDCLVQPGDDPIWRKGLAIPLQLVPREVVDAFFERCYIFIVDARPKQMGGAFNPSEALEGRHLVVLAVTGKADSVIKGYQLGALILHECAHFWLEHTEHASQQERCLEKPVDDLVSLWLSEAESSR